MDDLTDAAFEQLANDARAARTAFAFWAARNAYGETPAEHAMSVARYYEARAKAELLSARLQDAAKARAEASVRE